MARRSVILALAAVALTALPAVMPAPERAAVSASAPAQPADCLSGRWRADDAGAHARIVTSVSGLGGEEISIVRTGGDLVLTLEPDGRWEARYQGYTAEVAGAGGRATTSYTLDGAVRGTYDASAPGALSATMTELALDVYGSATLPVLGGTVDVTIRAGEAVPGLPAPPADLGSAGYICDGDRLTLVAPPPAWFFLPFAYTRLSETATTVAPDAATSPPPPAGGPARVRRPAAAGAARRAR